MRYFVQTLFLFACIALPLAAEGFPPDLKCFSGDIGQAAKAPVVSLIDSPCGQAVQAKAVADGQYQGLRYDLPEAVDLENVEAVEFDFYQTAYHQNGKAMLLLEYKDRKNCKIDFEFKVRQWNHVVIKLTDEMRGNFRALRLGVYAAMDRAGEIVAVANFKLIPRKWEVAKNITVDAKYMDVAYWRGNTGGNAAIAPEISLIDSICGKAVQVKALSNGKYQGMILTLPEMPDSSEIGTVEFDFRQSAYHEDGTAQLILRYDNGNGQCLLFPCKKKGWSHVVIPIDLRTVKMLRPGSPVHGKIKEAAFTIFSALDTAGETFAVANLRFVPKKEGAAEIAVKSYRYLSAKPNSGERGGNTLTDGEVGKNSQIHYDWYSEDPYIEFDLGALYLVNHIGLKGVAVPSQNISGITIETSSDGKKFRAAASVDNNDRSAVEKIFSLDSGKVNLTGRYFRIRGYRSRTDFPIDISEVTFSGKIPTDAELRAAAASAYSLGPEMPNISDKDYYIFNSSNGSFAICKKTGILRRLACDGVTVIDRILGRYDLSDGKKQILCNDYGATLIRCQMLDNGVEILYKVDQLDDIVFKRFYGWQEETFVSRLTFRSNRTDRQILQTGTEVVMPQMIRTGGRYETWGAGHSIEHKQADELTMEMPADTGPVVSFESPRQNLTFLHFRYRYADRYVQIGSGTVTVVGYGDKRTKFTDNGWVLGDGLFELNARHRTGSVESRLITVKGDLIQAFDQYLALPETKAFRSQIKRPAWLKDVRMYAPGDSWRNMFGNNAVGNAGFYEKFIREGCILNVQLNNTFIWGDWDKSLTGNRVINEFGGEMTAAEQADIHARMRKASPKVKLTEYTWMWSAHAHSDVFKQHPDWFIVKNASGATVSFFPGALNHYRLYGRPGSPSFEHAVKTITNTINGNNLDFWYLDGGGSPSAIDWFRLIIEEPDTLDAFYKTVRDMIRSNKDRGIFFNHPENPLGDIGYLEGSASAFFADANWRDGASWMYKFKLWQRSDARVIPCFTYWSGPAIENLHFYVIGTGLLPMITRAPVMNSIKYVSMYQQTRWAKLVSANFEPNWRNDSSCKWELMPLSFGKQGHLMVRSHFTETAAEKFSCDLAPLGLDNPSLPVYYYLYSVADGNGAIPESEAEAAYRATGWQSDFLLKGKFLGTRPWEKRLTQALTVPPRALRLIYVTQSPALVWSVDDLRIQYPMSEALGVRVSGQIKDSAIVLNAASSRRTAEVIANLPPGLTAVRVAVNGQAVKSVPMSVMNSNFVRFTIPQGNSKVVVELAEAAPAPQGCYALSADSARPGEKMTFILDTPMVSSQLNGNLVIFNSSDIPVWNGALALAGKQSKVTLSLPDVLTGGSYRAAAYDPVGKLLAEYPFTLADAPAELKPWTHGMSPLVGEVKDIAPVTSAAGTVITNCARQYSQNDSKIILDPANASVSLQMAKRTGEIWSFAAGAMLNTKLKRYIKVRIEGNYADFACRTGVNVRNVTPCYGDSPSASAITVDYETANGFTVRSFAGLGIVFADRAVNLPDAYGTKRVPEFISAVSGFCMGGCGSREELWLDLRELGAPDDWNGTAYLGLCLQNSSPARTLKLTLLETADTLPSGAETGKVAVMKGESKQAAKPLNVPVIEAKPTIDGVLEEEVWKNALTLTDFTQLNASTVSAPPSTLKMFSDGKKLYIGVEFVEPVEINADPLAGRAWQTDGVELYLGRGQENKTYDQYIFSAGGLCHSARNVSGQPTVMLAVPEWKCRIEDRTIRFEAAIPLKYADSDQDFCGFNAGRNRTGIRQGNYSLAPGNQYRNLSALKLVFK